MNAADVCHEVADCPGLFVDAFRGRFLRQTRDSDSAFVLTHYHGDHYQSLPREGKYQGPALIHCTPVTAALLIQVHQVPANFVVEHEYGQTFDYRIKGSETNQRANITFYDANHCPGACIVFIHLPNGMSHLHTGDMRYHERFKSYPLLREAVANQTLDLVYLDTTYSHPKHDFVPQEEAVESIASQAEKILSPETSLPSSSALVLLSCYSIGKEKVLWEASTRTNQQVYVSEKKFRMLNCIQGHESQEVSSQIVHRCTTDASQSDIHVIPMGLAGETWPYFRPNFLKCAEYVEELEKEYDRVVAFVPTGWANASKWNKEHAISEKQVEVKKNGKNLHVEVRLMSYSEHSAFSELVAFVEYLKPRKIIPTVFSDDADYRKIEGRFRNLLDSTRAKKAFFRSMQSPGGKPTAEKGSLEARPKATHKQGDSLDQNSRSEKDIEDIRSKKNVDVCVNYDSDIEIVEVKQPQPPTASNTLDKLSIAKGNIDTLVAMGFRRVQAETCFKKCGGKLDAAVNALLSADCKQGAHDNNDSPYRNDTGAEPTSKRGREPSMSNTTDPSSAQKKQKPSSVSPLITSFFTKKKS